MGQKSVRGNWPVLSSVASLYLPFVVGWLGGWVLVAEGGWGGGMGGGGSWGGPSE